VAEVTVLGIKIDSRQAVAGARKIRGALGKLGNSVFSLRGAFAALGLGLIAKQFVSAGLKFEQSVANLSAITGATGKDLEFLAAKSKEFGATTTLSASQAAEAFKLIASAKPDLLENGAALAQVTEAAIALAEATGQDLPTAAETLGTALNQFAAGAENANRFINVLAAGAKFGSSAVRDTAEALKFAGTVAAAAGVSFEKTNAAIQVLAKVGIKGGEAGTGLRNVILKLAAAGRDDLNPEVVGLSQALRNLRDENLSTAEVVKLFGLRSKVAAQQLIDQVDELDKLTDRLTDTGTAYEQQTRNTDTFGGSIKALTSAFESLQITMAGNNGALRSIVDNLTSVIRAYDQLQQSTDSSATSTEALGDIIDGIAITFVSFIEAITVAAKSVGIILGATVTAWRNLYEAGEKALSGDFSGAFQDLKEVAGTLPDALGAVDEALLEAGKNINTFKDALAGDKEFRQLSRNIQESLIEAVKIPGGAEAIPSALKRWEIRMENINKIRGDLIAQGVSETNVNKLLADSYKFTAEQLNAYGKAELDAIARKAQLSDGTKKLTDEQEEAAQTLVDLLQGLTQEQAVLGKSATATLEYRLRFGDLQEAVQRYPGDSEQFISAILNQSKALEENKKQLESSKKGLSEYASLVGQFGTQAEKLAIIEAGQVKKRKELTDAGKSAADIERLLTAEKERAILASQRLSDEDQRRIAVLNAQAKIIDANINLKQANGLLTAREAAYAHNAAITKLIKAEELYIEKLKEKNVLEGDPRIQQHRAAIINLTASYKTLGGELTKLLEGPFTDFFSDVFSGTKSITEAFKDMGDAIVNQINQLVAQELGQKLAASLGLGIGGNQQTSGGGNGLFDNIFGGGGFGDIFGSISSGIGDFFGGLGFANGGDFRVGGSGGLDSQLVSFRATPGETVSVTNQATGNGGGGSRPVNVTINMQGQQGQDSRQTAQQIAVAVGNATQRALRRDA